MFNEAGQLVYSQNFDAWGRERNPQTWDYTSNSTTKPEWLIRGYTGHEMLPEFGLINMNGRMYDPVLGRMLSPDNYVQAPSSTQSFNRYSYCWNNPLKYTDPSGEFLAAPMWALSFIGGGISNLVNGYNKPFTRAFHSSNSLVSGMGQAGQVNIHKGENFSISAGIDFFNFGISANFAHQNSYGSANAGVGYGFGGFYAGGNLSYNYNDFTFSLSGGISDSPGSNKMVSRYSLGINYKGAQLNLNHYGGKHPQFTWTLGYNNGVFSILKENDAFLNRVNKNGSDKFRTAAIELGFGYLRVGMSIYTNNPMEVSEGYTKDDLINKGPNQWQSKFHKKNKLGSGSYSFAKRIFSNVYFGYNNGLTISRIGVDAPGIQDYIQNGWHQSRVFNFLNKGGSPYIPTDYSQPVIPYFYGGYAFPTLY